MRTQLLIACNLLVLFLISCGPEPDTSIFQNKIQLENTSNKILKLQGYDTYDESYDIKINPVLLKETIEIENGGKGPVVISETRFSPIDNSTYFPHSGPDSIVLTFEDGKKYYSVRKKNDIYNNYWVANKSSLFAIFEKDVRKEGDVYIYSITQEDYENAHVLPE